MFDPKKIRRARTEEVRKLLSAVPEKAWTAPKEASEGVTFEIHSSFDLDSLCRAFPTQFRAISETVPPHLERWRRIQSAAGFTRTEERPDDKAVDKAPFALENPELGAVYVDLRDKSYIHFSPGQLPQGGLPIGLKKVGTKWKVTEGQNKLTFSLRGLASVDVEIDYSTHDKSSSAIASIVLSALLPGLDELAEMGLPLDKIKALGVPTTVETWFVNDKGKRLTRLARHQVSSIKTGLIEQTVFSIPEGFRDLRERKRGHGDAWHRIGGPRRRTPRGKRAARSSGSDQQYSQARAAYVAVPYPATTVQGPPKINPEPLLPQCLASTLRVSSAFEIRQSLLDAIQLVINLVANRIDTATGGRVDAADPENTAVELTIDWLAQLKQYNDGRNNLGDGLFCFLRDPPPPNDPLGGGTGILDGMAESLARELVAAEDPIPLGGEDDPVNLPEAIEDEIVERAADESIPPDERFGALLVESQAKIREEVLAQRIARINYEFNGNFGDQAWPNTDYDLVHFKLQLEQVEVEFSDDDTIRQLLIALADGDANQPRIDFELAFERLDATLTMERWPGGWFWWTAAGVLVALAIVGPAAVGGLIVTLVGLGPLGLLILAGLLEVAPVVTVAGGALILAAVTYLVWDVTQLRLSLGQPVLRSSVSPDRTTDPDEVVLDPDRVSLDGEITASVNSEIPSGIHQLFDAVVNFALTQFDAQVRETIESATNDGLEKAIHGLPHFRLPQPFGTQVRVQVAGAPFDHVEVDAPRHQLDDMSANGVAERLLSAGARSRMEFPFPNLAAEATQVDRDLRTNLTQRMDELNANGVTPRLGYAISQNLLNGIVFSQWLGGRFVRDYDQDQIEEAFATLINVCKDCAKMTEREVHVWAAASPQVFVTPRAYAEEHAKPYLSLFFPDVRLCISGIMQKPSTMEIQFSIQSVAHVAFGGLNAGNNRTFFSLESDFLNVLFDDRPEFMQLSPVGTQGLEINGRGFEAIVRMDEAARLQVLQTLQPLLVTAAIGLLRRNNFRQLLFVPDTVRLDQQVYDAILLANIHPRRASLYAVITTFGPIAQLLPHRDEDDNPVPPLNDFDILICDQGKDLRASL